MQSRSFAALTLTLVLALAGCGGTELEFDRGSPITSPDGGSDGGSSEFAAAADQVCEQVEQRFEEAQRETPRSFDEAVQVTEALVQIASQGDEVLGSLSPPEAEAAAFERYLDSRAEAVGFLETALEAARDEDGQAYEDARSALNDGSAKRSKLARQAGLVGCAAVESG